MGIAARVASCLMRVSNLNRSVDFYHDVFECQVTLREPDAVLLLTPDGFQLYLHQKEPSTQPVIGDVGIEQIMWSVGSDEELRRIENRLRAHYPSTYTNTLNGITFVDGIDPDGTRVLITYPTPEQIPREIIDGRFR